MTGRVLSPSLSARASLRVLMVLAEPPLPEGGPLGRCTLARLRGLRAHGVDVRAVAARQGFSLSGDPPPDVATDVVAVAAPRVDWRYHLRRLRRPLGELGRGAFAEQVRELARHADVVHLEEVETAWCDEGIATPALIQLNYLVGRDRPWGRPWRRGFGYRLELMLAERAAIRRHRWLVANSAVVGAALRHLAPHGDVAVVPLCLDPQYYGIAPLDGPPVAGIIGNAAWPPTAAAVRRLVTRIWPRILQRVPQARLRIAGRGTQALLGSAHLQGIEVVGEVASAAQFLCGLSVLINPLERGSGMKVKVLESLAVGLPVVATEVGAEGIDADDGVVRACDDAALADAAVELLVDAGARKQRGRAAREAFQCRYTPEAATASLRDVYARMAGA